MKITQVIRYLNQLDEIKPDISFAPARREMEKILHVVQSNDLQFDNEIQRLEQQYSAVMTQLMDFSLTLNDLRSTLIAARDRLEPEYLRESQRIYDHEMPFETNQYILDRRLRIDSDSDVLLRSRLRNLSDWRVPGLIFRPGRENYIEDLVPLDPLYVVDQHQDLLTPAVIKFTPEYQARLRQYVIDERRGGEFLSALPVNQFGLVFAYNYFNYKPISVIQSYLEQIYRLMRAGGTVIMTFNDCDRQQGAGLAEHFFMCYTPARMIVAAAERAGFEVAHIHHGQADLAWIELARPGVISSLRGGQTLAKVTRKI